YVGGGRCFNRIMSTCLNCLPRCHFAKQNGVFMMFVSFRARILAWSALLLCAPLTAARADDKVDFNRQVRTILSDKCFACHGPDATKVKGKLRLDLRDVAVKRGAIVPGKPEKSELVSRIFAKEETE